MKLLKMIWKKWQALGHFLGNFYAQVFLTIFYFVILWMIGMLRLFTDPLLLKNKGKSTNFLPWKHPKETLEEARNQY